MARSLVTVFLTWFATATVFVGCDSGDRPPLGNVSGKVSIDGSPLSGVIITFLPESGRPAVATTDADGKYVLEYVDGIKGAKIGPSTVRIMPSMSGSASQPIPQKYLNGAELKADVKSGKNTFDFELVSDKKATSKKLLAPD